VATAWRTLRGIEAMDMIRKGRVRRAGKGDVVAQGEIHQQVIRHRREVYGVTAAGGNTSTCHSFAFTAKARKHHDALQCPKHIVHFTREQGADQHCEVAAPSEQSNMHRGLGTLYAFGALPTSTDQLSMDWSSTDTWCSSSFARPTIVNGSVFVPTYAFSNGTFTTTCPLPGATSPAPSGILVYHL
jgi:hypothetical protein